MGGRQDDCVFRVLGYLMVHEWAFVRSNKDQLIKIIEYNNQRAPEIRYSRRGKIYDDRCGIPILKRLFQQAKWILPESRRVEAACYDDTDPLAFFVLADASLVR